MAEDEEDQDTEEEKDEESTDEIPLTQPRCHPDESETLEYFQDSQMPMDVTPSPTPKSGSVLKEDHMKRQNAQDLPDNDEDE